MFRFKCVFTFVMTAAIAMSPIAASAQAADAVDTAPVGTQVQVEAAPAAKAAPDIVSAQGIYAQIPYDSLAYIAVPALGRFKAGVSDFIGNLGMGMLPSDPVGMFMGQMGLYSGIDQSKGFAAVLLGESFSGMPAEQLFGPEGLAMMGPMEYPVVFIIGGASAKEIFAMKGPSEENGFTVFMDTTGIIMYAREVDGGYVAFSPNSEAVNTISNLMVSAAGSIANNSSPKRLAELGKTGIAVSGEFRRLAPLIDKGVEAVNALMAFQAAGAVDPMQQHVMKSLPQFVTWAAETLKQIEKLDLGLSFSGKGLQIDKLVTPRHRSDLSGMFSAMKPSGKSLVDGLPAGDFIAVGGMDIGKAMSDPRVSKIFKQYMDLYMTMVMPSLDPVQWGQISQEMMGVYTGDFVYSGVLKADADDGVMFMARNTGMDISKMLDLQEKMMPLLEDALTEMYNDLGVSGFSMDYNRNVGTVDGVSVDSMIMTAPTIPGQPSFAMPQEKQFMADAGNGDYVIASGKMENLSAIIQSSRNGGKLAANPRIMAAVTQMPAKPVMFGAVDIKGAFNAVIAMLAESEIPGFNPDDPAIKSVEPQCTELVVTAASSDADLMHGRLFLPAPLFIDIYKAAMVIQQAQMNMNNQYNDPAQGF